MSKWIVCVLLSVLATEIFAHVPKGTHAQVILRDGQVEVRIQCNPAAVVRRMQDPQAWLMGDVESPLPPGLNAQQQIAFLEEQIRKHSSVSLNGEKVTLMSTREWNHHTSDTHSSGHEIRLFAGHDKKQVSELTFQFARSLGKVTVSVVRPKYQAVKPGELGRVNFQ